MRKPNLRLLAVSDVSPMQPSGGSARVLREQALGLAGRGHSVTLLCRHPGGSLISGNELGEVAVHHYPVKRHNPVAYALSSLYGARRNYRRLFPNQSWDAVVFHQPFSAVGVHPVLPPGAPLLYCFYSPAGVEYRLRAKDPETERVPWGTDLVAAILSRLERRALRPCHKTVVLSEFSRRVLRDCHGDLSSDIGIIPGGVDLKHFHPPDDRLVIREKLGLPTDRTLLITIRDLEPRMGIDLLIQALAAIPDRRRIFCVIGGSGPLSTYLKTLASRLDVSRWVRFVGHIPEATLPLYYQAADLFVLPTVSHEGFGLVTVEALACGTPVVATPVGATPELLGPIDRRLLTGDTSSASLATSIADLLPSAMEPDLRRRCRAHVERHYSWSRHVQALEETLHSLQPGEIDPTARLDRQQPVS